MQQPARGVPAGVHRLPPGIPSYFTGISGQLRHLTLDHLAYLYIVIDLDQLISDALENAGYSLSTHSRFILFAGNAQFYPQETYHPEQYSSLLQSLNHGSSHYSILSIDKRKTFVIQGDFPRTGWNYLYFQDYDPLFSAIHTVLIRMILFSAVVVMIALFLALLLLRRILHHLDLLVEKIRRFGPGTPGSGGHRLTTITVSVPMRSGSCMSALTK